MTRCFRCLMPVPFNPCGPTNAICDQCIEDVREEQDAPERQFNPGCETDEPAKQ